MNADNSSISQFDNIQPSKSTVHPVVKGNEKDRLRWKSIGIAALKVIFSIGAIYGSYLLITPQLNLVKIEKLFINANERNTQQVAKVLENHSFSAGGCHVGVSVWHNYDIAVATQTKKVVIADFSQTTLNFHKTSIEFLKNCATREEFIQKMAVELLKGSRGPLTVDDFMKHFQFIIWKNESLNKDIPVKLEEYYKNISPNQLYDTVVSALRMEMQRPGSWLASEDHFNYMKDLAKGSHIHTHLVNLTDQNSFQHFSSQLKNICPTVNTLYLSNAHDWIHSAAAKELFVENVKSLVDERSLIIDAAIKGNFIYQKVSTLSEWPSS